MKGERKHILVISDPPAAPGYLPRVRSLCEYFVQKGHEVTLLTEEYQPLDFAHTYPIRTIRMYSGGSFDWFIKTVWTLLTDWHDRVFAQRALSTMHGGYDMVICSAFSDFPLGAAQRIAQALNVPLICDIRDLDEQVDDSKYQYKHQSQWLMPFRWLYRTIHIRRHNKVLRAANAITTISPWHAEFIKNILEKKAFFFERSGLSSLSKAVYTVYNGYDEKQFYPQDIKTDRFTITYIGSLFEWQKPALEKVKKAIEGLDLALEVHTPQHDPVAYKDLGDTIRQSSIMLVLTNEKTHGMLTTKFYEALGCEKPILCVPSDKGALAELMAYTNAGLASDDIDEIKAFILGHYEAWKQNGFTRQATQHREEFTRTNQYDQFYRTYL